MPPLLLRPPPPPPAGGLAAPGDAVPGAAHPCRLAMGVRSAARCSRAACAIHDNRALLQRIWNNRPLTDSSACVTVHSCAQKPVVVGQHWMLSAFAVSKESVMLDLRLNFGHCSTLTIKLMCAGNTLCNHQAAVTRSAEEAGDS
jgi:hypothetical protein